MKVSFNLLQFLELNESLPYNFNPVAQFRVTDKLGASKRFEQRREERRCRLGRALDRRKLGDNYVKVVIS